MEARFGILELPRGVESAIGHARLAEQDAFAAYLEPPRKIGRAHV